MCQVEGCALVCRHKNKDGKSRILLSHNSGKNEKAIAPNICSTSLCMISQVFQKHLITSYYEIGIMMVTF